MKQLPTPVIDIPTWVAPLVEALAPLLSAKTQFVLQSDDSHQFGVSSREGELVVHIANSESVRNLGARTDGTYTDSKPLTFGDGSFVNRKIVDWNYVIIENAIMGVLGQPEIRQVCYVRNVHLKEQLRAAVGLDGLR